MSTLVCMEAKAFVPARDFERSKRFYSSLGFSLVWATPDLACFKQGPSAFLLQNCHVEACTQNFKMHLLVKDVDAWWQHVASVASSFGIPVDPPEDCAWGMRDFALLDARGVLWRIGQPIHLESSCKHEAIAACLESDAVPNTLGLPPRMRGVGAQRHVVCRVEWFFRGLVTMPKRVLVVDDNRDAADSLAVILEVCGHETRAAYNGQQAVEVAEEFGPDIVILDINMPVMNGYEAARSLRYLAGERLILVAVTGVPMTETREKAEQSGFDAHFVKPIGLEDLEEAMRVK
ncbi:response regulator [Aquabacterium sp. A7-Y]|uniref:response regulator n=1 Tax=Aquabacterium sp. A7-Y TaxID=1349605 RepID=UPI00223DFFC5|nr:response regulator [Aquabacterium sp. A7-Y]MCW7539383.1 response regulator [Aquabacterium sp. A7-Y]